jgi:DNA-binding CsgD family transcriptional regulator
MKRIYLSPRDHVANNELEGYMFAGINKENQQVFINQSREVKLSIRENEIYTLLTFSNKEIANIIEISEKSVINYRLKIKSKGF